MFNGEMWTFVNGSLFTNNNGKLSLFGVNEVLKEFTMETQFRFYPLLDQIQLLGWMNLEICTFLEVKGMKEV